MKAIFVLSSLPPVPIRNNRALAHKLNQEYFHNYYSLENKNDMQECLNTGKGETGNHNLLPFSFSIKDNAYFTFYRPAYEINTMVKVLGKSHLMNKIHSIGK